MSADVTLNLVGGQFVSARSGATIDVMDPASTTNRVGRVPAMDRDDLAAVFDAAEVGAKSWRAIGHLARGRILIDAADLIRADAANLTSIIVSEMGKTRAEASGEVGKAAEFFEYFGAMARFPFGEILPDARPGTFATQTREPLGIVLLITPWNDPLLTPARKLAPALVAGNAVVIKPATVTPLITLHLAEILHRAGLPAGSLGTVTGLGSDIGDDLIADRRIKAISFTGSTNVGIDLQRKLGGTGVRVQTEMGGKNAVVVLDDADLDLVLPAIMGASFGQTGQRCTAASRLIVQRGIAAETRNRIAAAVARLTVGPGADPETDVGPVVSQTAQKNIQSRLARGVAEGASVMAQAMIPPPHIGLGNFVAPTFLMVDRENSLWKEEVFGPILGMIEVDSIDEAIDAVNHSPYGLSSAVFTGSLQQAYAFIDGVDTGQVSVNQPTSGWDIHQPFGGFKDSGSPFKEQGLDALRFYTRVKTAAIRTH
jgi:acyl-CoA reductase-like NAD-dependent aldehyde dehydrogenase